MREQLNAPIAFDKAHRGHYYTEPTFRLSLPQLKQGELIALFLAERMMHQFRGTPFEPDLRQAISKLGDMLPDGVSVRLDAVADFLSVLPATESQYDPKLFLCPHVRGRLPAPARRALLVGEPKRENPSPVRPLRSRSGRRWLVRRLATVISATTSGCSPFSVLRRLRETGETFDRPADFRVVDYLKGSFRAVRGDGDYVVVLRFRADVARRFAERRWHASQVLEPAS